METRDDLEDKITELSNCIDEIKKELMAENENLRDQIKTLEIENKDLKRETERLRIERDHIGRQK